MSPQRHIAYIFLCSSTEQIAQGVLAINISCSLIVVYVSILCDLPFYRYKLRLERLNYLEKD